MEIFSLINNKHCFFFFKWIDWMRAIVLLLNILINLKKNKLFYNFVLDKPNYIPN